MVIPFLATTPVSTLVNPYDYSAADAVIEKSDHDVFSLTGTYGLMYRPHCSDPEMSPEMPGGRYRFRTSSPNVFIGVRYHTIALTGAWDNIGLVMADGVVVETFVPVATSGAENVDVEVNLGSEVDRLIEVVMPYGQPMYFRGVSVDDGYTVTSAAARPSSRIAIHGDSITHGYYATRVDKTWPFLLNSSLTTRQCINMGAAGYVLTAGDGTLLGNMGCDGIVTNMGANSSGLGLSCQPIWEDFVGRLRAIQPTVPLVIVTLIWRDNPTGEAQFELFRQGTRNAVTALSDANITLVEGPDLITHSSDRYHDSLHPNDLGCSEFAANLAPYLITAFA